MEVDEGSGRLPQGDLGFTFRHGKNNDLISLYVTGTMRQSYPCTICLHSQGYSGYFGPSFGAIRLLFGLFACILFYIRMVIRMDSVSYAWHSGQIRLYSCYSDLFGLTIRSFHPIRYE